MCTSGYLPGRVRQDLLPVSLSSCLTGSAQVAIVAYRLQESLGERELVGAFFWLLACGAEVFT